MIDTMPNWIYEDQLPDGYPYDEFWHRSRVVDGVRMFPDVPTGEMAMFAYTVEIGSHVTFGAMVGNLPLRDAKVYVPLSTVDRIGKAITKHGGRMAFTVHMIDPEHIDSMTYQVKRYKPFEFMVRNFLGSQVTEVLIKSRLPRALPPPMRKQELVLALGIQGFIRPDELAKVGFSR